MWVYQEALQLPEPSADNEKATPVRAQEISAPPELPPEQVLQAPEPRARREPASLSAASAAARPTASHSSRDILLLAGAYLFGTFLAGILCALCTAGEAETLNYYLSCWREAFSAANAAEAAGLFRAELLTAGGALGVLLLLGLSALGTVPIFFFMMLYGAGAGMLSFQLLTELRLRTLLIYWAASGIPTALAAGCLCMFGAAALQVSWRIQRGSFGRALYSTGAWGLLRRFARTLFLLLPICGAATGLLYLCSQAGFLG